MGERRRFADEQQQLLAKAEQDESRRREQEGEQHARPIERRYLGVPPGAAGLGDQHADRGQHALHHDQYADLERGSEPTRGQRFRPDAAEQHRVGDTHGHLRQLRRRQRHADPKSFRDMPCEAVRTRGGAGQGFHEFQFALWPAPLPETEAAVVSGDELGDAPFRTLPNSRPWPVCAPR